MQVMSSIDTRAYRCRRLWFLWDRPDGDAVMHVGYYPLADLRYLEAQGLLTFDVIDTHCGCPNCEDMPCGGCVVEEVVPDATGLRQYVVSCAQEGVFVVPETRLYRYRPITGHAMAGWLAHQLDCTGEVEQIVPGRLWALGRYRAQHPLFFARETHRQDAAQALAPLHDRVKSLRGLVLLPAQRPPTGVLPNHVDCLTLAEIWQWDEEQLVRKIDVLDQCVAATMPVTAYVQPVPVPAGFTWPQIRLEFISDEDVRIWTVGEPVVKSFQELGLMNTRNRRPTKSWQLLREFAGHDGVYDPAHPSVLYAPEKIERRGGRQPLTAFSGKLGTALSDLAGQLSKLFPVIPGRAIAEYDARKHQYRAEIRLSWEPGYRQRKAMEYGVKA